MPTIRNIPIAGRVIRPMSFVQSETFITDYVVTGAVEFPGNIGGMTAAATRRRSLIELC